MVSIETDSGGGRKTSKKTKGKSAKKKKELPAQTNNHWPKGGSKKSHLKKVLPFLQMFKELRPVQRGILLDHLNDESCETLCETITNVLTNPKLAKGKRTKLKKVLAPHKNSLRSLTKPRLSKKTKRKRLNQIGGFPIAAILGAAIPLLINLITRK